MCFAIETVGLIPMYVIRMAVTNTVRTDSIKVRGVILNKQTVGRHV